MNKIVDKNDARYRRNDRQIRKVLLDALTERRLTLRPMEVCRQATITQPTFYTHCKNADDALRQYEQELIVQLAKRLPGKAKKYVLLTIILSFINDEKDYFIATIKSANYYLLSNIFRDLKHRLGYKNVVKKHYEFYIQQQIALICCWGKYEGFEQERIPFYVEKMAEIEIVNLDS